MKIVLTKDRTGVIYAIITTIMNSMYLFTNNDIPAFTEIFETYCTLDVLDLTGFENFTDLNFVIQKPYEPESKRAKI
jgi:hypothetical protein